MRSSFSQLVRLGVIWSLIQNWGLRLGGLIVFMILARILSPAEMGLFAAATTVIAFCALFVDSGLSEAIVQAREVTPKQLSSVFVLNLASALALVFGLWVGASAIAAYFKLSELVWILRASCLSILFSAFTFSQMAMCRRAFAYKRLASVTIGATLFAGAVAIGMALRGAGVWSLVAQTLLTAAYTASMLWRRPEWQLQWGFEWREVKGLASYGVQRLLTSLLDFANTRLIDLILVAGYGVATLGLYTVGARVYQALMQVLCSAILDIAHNAFSRLADDLPRLRNAYYGAMELAAATSMPIFLLLAALAPELNRTLFGSKWAGADQVFVPLLLLGGVQVLQFFNGVMYNAMGRPGISLQFVFGKTVVTMSALYFANGMAFVQVVWVFFVSQVIITPVSFHVAKRVVAISYCKVVQAIWPFVTGALVAVAGICVARGFVPSDWAPVLRLVILGCVGGSLYLATVLAVAMSRVRHLIAVVLKREPVL